MAEQKSKNPLRVPDADGADVSNAELFFDLVYVFSAMQLTGFLLHHLSPLGALQATVLWFAVWLGWQYTAWVTNWFNPDHLSIRLMLFLITLGALVMAVALPEAFGEAGLLVAGCYAVMQIGRTLYALRHLADDHHLHHNFQRILAWNVVSAGLWIAGGFAAPEARLYWWLAAVGLEYIAPMVGFYTPLLGRSRTKDWTIDGKHLAERCALFVIVALGETIISSGGTLAKAGYFEALPFLTFLAAFLGSIAMWWLYFDTSSEEGTRVITKSPNPGRIGALFHYTHVPLVGAIIAAAAGTDLAIEHPAAPADVAALCLLLGGPALYIFGNGLYKTVVYGRFPLSHIGGLALLGLLTFIAPQLTQLYITTLATLVLLITATWEWRARAYLEHSSARTI